jgi:hypothetical protein
MARLGRERMSGGDPTLVDVPKAVVAGSKSSRARGWTADRHARHGRNALARRAALSFLPYPLLSRAGEKSGAAVVVSRMGRQ